MHFHRMIIDLLHYTNVTLSSPCNVNVSRYGSSIFFPSSPPTLPLTAPRLLSAPVSSDGSRTRRVGIKVRHGHAHWHGHLFLIQGTGGGGGGGGKGRWAISKRIYFCTCFHLYYSVTSKPEEGCIRLAVVFDLSSFYATKTKRKKTAMKKTSKGNHGKIE